MQLQVRGFLHDLANDFHYHRAPGDQLVGGQLALTIDLRAEPLDEDFHLGAVAFRHGATAEELEQRFAVGLHLDAFQELLVLGHGIIVGGEPCRPHEETPNDPEISVHDIFSVAA